MTPCRVHSGFVHSDAGLSPAAVQPLHMRDLASLLFELSTHFEPPRVGALLSSGTD